MNLYGIPEISFDPEDYEGQPLPDYWEKWGRIARTTDLGPDYGYHFYTSDHQFTGLWHKPETLVASGVRHVVELNYSTWPEMPKALFLADLYRKRSLSALWSEMGLQVWVDVNVEVELYGLNSLGVPDGYPWFATRYQGTLPDGRSSGLEALEADYLAACRTAGTDQIDFLVYGGYDRVQRYCEDRGWYWVPDSNGFTTERFKANRKEP